MKKYMTRYISILCLLLATAMQQARALPVTHYAPDSRLAEGKWVKISVATTGLYRITTSQLRQWGFSNPEKVYVYGYGGHRIPDLLNASNYIDDLPAVQQLADAQGIVFYAEGPDKWVTSAGDYKHCKNNIYTNYGYYFVSDVEPESVPEIKSCGVAELSANAATTFLERVHHERDITQPGEVGYTLVGESFQSQPTVRVTLPTPDAVPDTTAWVEVVAVSKIFTATTLSISVNGRTLTKNTGDNVAATPNSGYISATQTTSRHVFDFSSSTAEIGVTFNNVTQAQGAWLDYVSLNYHRHLRLPQEGVLAFSTSSSSVRFSGEGLTVWDVTSPLDIKVMNTRAEGGVTGWTNDYHGERDYVAFSSSAKLPQPVFVRQVRNQNLHGQEPVEMLILTTGAARAASERIADLHRQAINPLTVRVVNVEDVYNEFSSGMADVSGLRKYLKMNYDRGNAADTTDRLRYVLLMGKATTDNRHLSSAAASLEGLTIPVWMGGSERQQYSDNDAFGTDDFIAILGDDSGLTLGLDDLSVAVGRIPVTTAEQAKSIVDKIEQYAGSSKKTSWKNQFIFLCDAGDEGIHAKQSQEMIDEMLKTDNLQVMNWRVYTDAYTLESGAYRGARDELYRHLDEGVLWWNYIGHANNHSLGNGGIVTYNDINNMYLNKVPVLFAATCDFLRWDSSTTSGGEILFFERYGGCIAMISATRPVYITDNGYLTKAMGRAMQKRDETGRLPRLGDIYRNAKNNILNSYGEHRSNTNRLRYVLMGDPALELQMPSNVVTLDSIDGKSLTGEEQLVVPALGRPVLSGSVRTPEGEVIADFNGNVEITLYDAEQSNSTLDSDPETRVTYDQQGPKIYVGVAKVNNGKYSLRTTLPGEISDNFRPATLNMYAYSTSDAREAVGTNSDFYVYGIDTTAPKDTVAPEITMMVLNHESFKDGDTVNENPMLIANAVDNVGLNISTSGVGHQMSLTLDRLNNHTDASLYFTPSADDPAAGTINYPLEGLTDGAHTLRLRVWDTSGNSSSRGIEFFVQSGLTPKIHDIYTDTNPASTEANFYISHNRPDQLLTVTVTVYNLMGKAVWSGTASGIADMFTSAPVTWNLQDYSGRRVPRGIYLYRAEITDKNGLSHDTGSRRIAVTAE